MRQFHDVSAVMGHSHLQRCAIHQNRQVGIQNQEIIMTRVCMLRIYHLSQLTSIPFGFATFSDRYSYLLSLEGVQLVLTGVVEAMNLNGISQWSQERFMMSKRTVFVTINLYTTLTQWGLNDRQQTRSGTPHGNTVVFGSESYPPRLFGMVELEVFQFL